MNPLLVFVAGIALGAAHVMAEVDAIHERSTPEPRWIAAFGVISLILAWWAV